MNSWIRCFGRCYSTWKVVEFDIDQLYISVQNLYPMPSSSRLRFCSIWKLRGSKKAKGIWVSDGNVELSLKRLVQKLYEASALQNYLTSIVDSENDHKNVNQWNIDFTLQMDCVFILVHKLWYKSSILKKLNSKTKYTQKDGHQRWPHRGTPARESRS